ncbi:MAG: hypothetical protein ACREMR_05740 [Gemmatimonadales bacterium]
MTSWVAALRTAGVVPVSYVPDASVGRADRNDVATAALVEGDALSAHPIDPAGAGPSAACFIDGIQRWRVVGVQGVVPIVRAYVAAAARRRGPDRRLATVADESREFVITQREGLQPPARRALEESGLEIVDLPAEDVGQPSRTLTAAHLRVDRAREAMERSLAERCAAGLGPEEWLVVDGLLSDSERLAAHPRALGVIKSHGTQFFEGADLERALTLPDRHRTSVFAPRSHAHRAVYSWYLRLWPWEGNDLLYGLLRIEARAHPETVTRASATSGWLYAERAPLTTPDTRWDRLLYPIHDVETYLNARTPRDLIPAPGSRLPRTGA